MGSSVCKPRPSTTRAYVITNQQSPYPDLHQCKLDAKESIAMAISYGNATWSVGGIEGKAN